MLVGVLLLASSMASFIFGIAAAATAVPAPTAAVTPNALAIRAPRPASPAPEV